MEQLPEVPEKYIFADVVGNVLETTCSTQHTQIQQCAQTQMYFLCFCFSLFFLLTYESQKSHEVFVILRFL